MEPLPMDKAQWGDKAPGLAMDAYKFPLSVFLFVNDLTEFQRVVIPLFMKPNPWPSEVAKAKAVIDAHASKLAQGGWTPEGKKGDMVNQPGHYARFPLEPTTFIVENQIDWCRGNALKYICRFLYKNGVEDLRKAVRYLSLYERYRQGDQGWSK